MAPTLILTIIGSMLAGMTFFAGLVYWIVNRIDKVRFELITMRTNDMAHLNVELVEIRKALYGNQSISGLHRGIESSSPSVATQG